MLYPQASAKSIDVLTLNQTPFKTSPRPNKTAAAANRRRLFDDINRLCAYSGRICGNNTTSRMLGESVSNITKRSMPMPQPPVGGKPYSMARM